MKHKTDSSHPTGGEMAPDWADAFDLFITGMAMHLGPSSQGKTSPPFFAID